MLKKNQLPAFRVGSDWRFTVEAIDKWRAEAEAGALGRSGDGQDMLDSGQSQQASK
jgi:hypothetical protein